MPQEAAHVIVALHVLHTRSEEMGFEPMIQEDCMLI